MVKDFLVANDLYDHNWPGVRSPRCDQPCKSARGVTIHSKHCILKPEGEQRFAGTCAAKKVRKLKLEAAQKLKATVKCGDEPLKNTYLFKYLGSIFAADGDQKHDVKRRIALVTTRMGQLRHVFNSSISFAIKMKVYKTAVCSLLTYGSEAWDMDEQTRAHINGANASLLSRFTGKDAHQEASTKTRSYDLVKAIKQRRMKWLGHLLRLQGERLVKLATWVQLQRRSI